MPGASPGTAGRRLIVGFVVMALLGALLTFVAAVVQTNRPPTSRVLDETSPPGQISDKIKCPLLPLPARLTPPLA
jgi:hypothetical protein